MAKAKPLITLAEGESIPLNRLRLSDDNVRKVYSKEAIADLAADIRTNDLIQSLSVRKLEQPDGAFTHEVQGGGRRFRALHLLVKQKALAPDAPIPCLPNDRQIATQISLAENVQREALSPLDEFRAYAEMASKGKPEADIARDNRVTLRHVKQRLRLGTASPLLHKAFEDNKISLDTLVAFCVTDNLERQEQVWNQIKGQGHINAWSLKQMLLEDAVSTSDKRVKFVGLDSYEKAGGLVERDLFDDGDAGYVKDVDLLNELVQAKLDREADKLKKMGWSWALTGITIPYADTAGFDQFSAENEDLTEEQEEQLRALEAKRDELQQVDPDKRTRKQSKRLEALQADIDALENPEPMFKPEDMARAGVTVEISSGGELLIEYGYVKPEDSSTEECASEGANEPAGTAPNSDEDDDGPAKLPDSLVMDLTEFRTASLQAALTSKPDVAFVATLHAMAMSALRMCGSTSCLQIRADTDFPGFADGLKEYGPMKAMADQRKAWTARLPHDSTKLWAALEAMSRQEQMQLLAFLAASTVNVVVQKHDSRTSQVRHSHVLADALMHDMRKDWKPTADNFFKRVTKASILAAVAEARGEKTADLISHCKKQGMAMEAERLVDGTGWLPEPLRLATGPDVQAPAAATEEIETDLPAFLADDGEGEDAHA